MSDIVLRERSRTFVLRPGARIRVELGWGDGAWETKLDETTEPVGLKTVVEIRTVTLR